MRAILLFLLVLSTGFFQAGRAQTPITLDDIWKDYSFTAKALPGFNFLADGRHYTVLKDHSIAKFDLLSGLVVETLFDGGRLKGENGFDGKVDSYEFSEDESKILIENGEEALFRHSTQANFFVWDGSEISPVFPEAKQRYAGFNPQADKVAFVLNNDLYYKDLKKKAVVRITQDGEVNRIINGATDWVYEEEFSFAQAYQWSPDGKKIAFYRFDESAVAEFTLISNKGELYPSQTKYKYPKVGTDNALVSIHIYDIDSKKTRKVDLGPETDQYIPRIKWTQDPNQLCVFRMNRHQNELELLLADAKTGKTRLLLKESSPYYVDIHDNLTFLKDGRHFLWTSEQGGWNHIYLYDMEGQLVRQLTQGEWEVTDFYGVDEAKGTVFYQATDGDPLRRSIHSITLDGQTDKVLRRKGGWHRANFSGNFDYFVDGFSTANTPPTYTLVDRNGLEKRLIEDNAHLRILQEAHGVQPLEFFSFTTSEEVELNGYMIKPADFDETKKYPVLMYLYGGPGSQEATDSWKGQNYWWFQMLAQQGYVIACVDNRGTGGRGEEFKKMTYLKMGHYETIDQIEAAKKLGSLPFVDPNRIGIFGWSYGGFMSSLCLFKGSDVFKAAIAVAPVTHWKWYDTIYTERYMRTPAENPEGYEDNSPVLFADRLKGNYLLVHGTGDDNVHFQNTEEMVNALIKANKQFDTYFYPNRNHGISGGPTRLHLFTKMTSFLNEKLMKDNRPVGAQPKP
ncbi:MAG: S9 family peptidase [Saprospirales bacterium]|nr:S9 family peptidase [Saprospirales bacterium]